MISIGLGEVRADMTVTSDTRWLPVLEREMRHRMGWIDEAITPFPRTRRPTERQLTTHRPRSDTLLFPSGERKSA